MKIPILKMYWDNEDTKAVQGSIQAGMNWAIGPQIEEFEKMLADYIGVRYAVAMNSGTSALHATLLAYGIGAGDEVIVPSFTFIATANAPLFVGATPVFADIDDTYGLDPKDVERKITSKMKAILPIHYGGSACSINELRQVADRHNLLLIEDACESLGATVEGKKVGSFGDCSILSFCSAKLITTGEGGAVLTNSNEIYEKLKLIRSHGMDGKEFTQLGYNFRMSNITASLGVAQMGKVDELIKMRCRNAERLSHKLAEIVEIPECNDVYQMYTIRTKHRDALSEYLSERGIGNKVYFPSVHLTSFHQNGCRLPITEKVSQEVLTLPMYPSLTEEEIDYIADGVISFFGGEYGG